MNFILLFDRVKNKALRMYRNYVFKKQIGCNHKEFSLIGKVHLINKNIKLGKNVNFYPDVMLFGDGVIEIGDNVDIGNNTLIYASKGAGVKIGKNTLIAAHNYIIDADHGVSKGRLIRDQENSVASVEIGEDVWLGAGCKVLKGTTIQSGAVLGAQSVVKGDIKENGIYVGVPAKFKKNRE